MATLPDDPEIVFAKSRRGKGPQNHSRNTVLRFSKYADKTPHELLKMQEAAMNAPSPDDRYVVVDLVKNWIAKFEGQKSTKLNYASTVRRFFAYWHRPLPEDDTWIRSLKSDRETVEPMLTPDNFKTILAACRGDLRLRSMLLVMLQSFSGTRELCIIGNTMGLKIAKELKEGSNRIELHFPTGRKHSDNPWYTYIGKDACEILREWFKERGYPTEDNPWIWPSLASRYGKAGGPITESAVMQVFTRIIVDLKLRAPIGSGEKHTRYGISIGQVRDLAASLAQRVEGKANDTGDVYTDTTTNYFQGHTLDKLKYRKLHTLDPEYRRRMYELVEPVLSPISNPNFLMTRELIQTQEQVGKLEKTIEIRDKEMKGMTGTMRYLIEETIKRREEDIRMLPHSFPIHPDPKSGIVMKLRPEAAAESMAKEKDMRAEIQRLKDELAKL